MEILFFLFVVYLIIVIIGKIFTFIGDTLSSILGPIWVFTSDNIYLIGAAFCFLSATFYLLWFKPHKAELYFKQYKNNIITRQQAITQITETMYEPTMGVPPALNSKITEKRLKALRKRVKAEEEFIRDLRDYIRTKES